MSYVEGQLEIPLEDFWAWVIQYYQPVSADYELVFGVPKVNPDNHTLDITFAGSNTCDPRTWKRKPKAVLEWEPGDKMTVAAGNNTALDALKSERIEFNTIYTKGTK